VTPEKRKKIKAMLDNPASTENEKVICRKILKDNPAPASDGMFHTMPGPENRSLDERWRRQSQSPWGLRDNFFDGLFGGIAGGALGGSANQAAAQAQRDAHIRHAAHAKHNRQSSWETFKQRVFQSQEDRDRKITLQREAIQNSAQQRLVDLLKKKK